MGRRRAVVAALAGAAAARLALRVARSGRVTGAHTAGRPGPPGNPLARTNFRGREVSLAGGLAYAAGAGGVAALAGGPVGVAAAVAGLGAGVVGAYDDA